MIESILLILFFGLLSNKLFTKLKLPGLLGMIFTGILLGPYGLGLLDESIMNSSGDIRLIALIIILLRAGLGINKETLKKVGKVSIKMSAIPCMVEGFTLMFVAYKLFHMPLLQAGMLAFIIAAVSPAVVVPSMLELKEKKLGMNKGVPIIILAGSSIDDIFAITLFTAFLGMEKSSGGNLGLQLLNIPKEIIGGILLGVVGGYILISILNFKVIQNVFNKYLRKENSTSYLKSKILKLTNLEKLCILLVTAFALKLAGDFIHVSGLLAVMTMGFLILEMDKPTAKNLEKGLNNMWFFAQIFLFVLIGAAVNTKVAIHAGGLGIVVIAIGLLGRTLGVMIALQGSNLNIKERTFCAIAYSPKATVQAAIGGVPLAAGVVSGEFILAMAVLSIILTAPLGAIGIKLSAPKLLESSKEYIEKTA